MILNLLYMDSGTELFCGFGTLEPFLLWKAPSGTWVEIPLVIRQSGWAARVSPREASRCYPRSVETPLPSGCESRREFSFEDSVRLRPELFDDYDGPYTRRSPDEYSNMSNIKK
jgi:hypothetical protein